VLNKLRHNLTRKVAVLAIFGLVLGGSGLASLAQLQSTVTTTVTASVTSIDLSANGTKTLAVDLGQVIPGDLRTIPITFVNNGSGYVNLPSTATSNGSAVSLASVRMSRTGISPSECATSTASDWTQMSLTDPLWPTNANVTIAGGATLDLCIAYRVGAYGGTYTGEGMVNTLTFAGFHP
jgi:hypothetical protein